VTQGGVSACLGTGHLADSATKGPVCGITPLRRGGARGHGASEEQVARVQPAKGGIELLCGQEKHAK